MTCKMNVLGTHWTNCGAPSDSPCMCDVVVFEVPTCQNRHCTRYGKPMRESETGWFCSGKDGGYWCDETG